MLNKLYILLCSLYGYCLKFAYVTRLLRVHKLGEKAQADVVVSLTSYGRRVRDCIVCYTVYSLLRQTLQPKRIILWLSQDEWTESTLPERVAQLKQYGVEIRFCEDMRSYKKLLPALKLLPEEDIITVDDDILYPKSLIHHLVDTHLQYPNIIIAPLMKRPLKRNNQLLPYTQWYCEILIEPDISYLPLGGSGCYYPKHSLASYVTNYTLAQQYAPLADDVWFWAAGIVQRTPKRTTDWTYTLVSFDAIYQFLHKGSALQHTNVKGTEMTNDTQIAATMTYIRENYEVS